MMAVTEVGAALSAMKRPKAKILHEALDHAETLAASVLSLLERAAEGVLLTLPDERLVFFGLHVLAAARRSEVYRPLIRFLNRPEDEVDRLFDDNVFEIVPALVVSVFDGDPAPLIASIEDPTVCEQARCALLSAITRLCFDGAVSRETVWQLVVRLDDEHLIETDSIAWLVWQDAVAMLGFSDLADRVRRSWDDERNFAVEEERQDWEEMLAGAIREPTDQRRFEANGLAPIDDPAAVLEEVGSRADTGIAAPADDPLARVALDAEEIGWLDYFLCSPKAPENTLGLEETDGLFAALISGPVPVAPSEAFATVWGGAGEHPDFDDAEQAQYVLDLLTRHWNVIAARLARNVSYQPVINEFGGEEYGRAWGRGFIRGMLLRFDEWRRLLDDGKERVNLMPIFALAKAPEADDDELDEQTLAEAVEWEGEAEWDQANEGVIESAHGESPDREEDEDGTEEEDGLEDGDWDVEDDEEESSESLLTLEMRAELASGLPFCVSRIHRFWQRRAGRSAVPPAASRKIGRNEPCPCGSGKKYKRCCGA
jgi:yecA family protein